MTTTLRVVVDDVVAPASGGIGRYAEELTRELILTAPRGCEVAGIISAAPPADYDAIATLLPGLSDLYKSALARRELQLAWQHGITRLPGEGMVHSPSLFAPLSRHDPANDVGTQTVVTIHDVIAWTHPDALPSRQVGWVKSMVKRAHKYADAVVVPSYSVADALTEIHDFGDRIRVIGGAVSSKLSLPVDDETRAIDLDLPDRYILAAGTVDPHKGLAPLIRSLASDADAGLPLLVAGRAGHGRVDLTELASDAGIDPARVRELGFLSDADLSVALDRATVFAFPSLAEGFGLPIIEAFHFNTPVVHSDAPAVLEVAADAGIAVARDDPNGYPDRLAEAIATVAHDPVLAERLGYAGADRAAAFSWKDSAQRVWQLHADL